VRVERKTVFEDAGGNIGMWHDCAGGPAGTPWHYRDQLVALALMSLLALPPAAAGPHGAAALPSTHSNNWTCA